MAWDTILPIMVRNLIGDLDSPPTYSDARIKDSIVVAGLLVVNDYPFQTGYTFDLETPDITPDPTEEATLDTEAMALFSLKAACMLNMSSYQSSVKNGIRVRDGDSEVDTTAGFRGFSDIIALGPCKAYMNLLEKLTARASSSGGRAVMSPVNVVGFYGGDYRRCFENIYNSLI